MLRINGYSPLSASQTCISDHPFDHNPPSLQDMSVEILLIPRDVQTRWNSTYKMLVFILEHRVAIKPYTGDPDNDLRKYELKGDDSDSRLGSYRMLLNDVTHLFSRSTTNLANVIPVMDIINDCFSLMANDDSLSPAIRIAIGAAKRTLNLD
ncbi:hypothetical protein BJ912DRAFT_867670 [Pholiota molesta]|nr:hypothetical protein BJ912DRAFT_867670 [Pholiota molesta]